jgi:hypothetical protein
MEISKPQVRVNGNALVFFIAILLKDEDRLQIKPCGFAGNKIEYKADFKILWDTWWQRRPLGILLLEIRIVKHHRISTGKKGGNIVEVICVR